MPLPELLAILTVLTVCALLMAGYPVALTLGGASLAFALLGHALGAMDLALLGAFPQRVFGVMTNDVLLAIPLFALLLALQGVAQAIRALVFLFPLPVKRREGAERSEAGEGQS